ncbi:MAG: hypothetical protein ACK5TP_03850, partial [bacterium]
MSFAPAVALPSAVAPLLVVSTLANVCTLAKVPRADPRACLPVLGTLLTSHGVVIGAARPLAAAVVKLGSAVNAAFFNDAAALEVCANAAEEHTHNDIRPATTPLPTTPRRRASLAGCVC